MEHENNWQAIIDWCNANDYVLVKKRKKPLDFETICSIAEKVCLLEPDESKVGRRFWQLPFSRYLQVTYLYNFMPPMELAKKLNIHHTMISYAIKQGLFHQSEFKFLKKWQQNAVINFINEVELLGGTVDEVNIRHQGFHTTKKIEL